MKNTSILFKLILILLVAVLTSSFAIQHKTENEKAKTDSPTSGQLFNEIAHLDSMLLVAFNSRDLEGFKGYFNPGLELYQDNIGVRNYDESMKAFGELFKKDYVLTRKLVPGSLEIYPIKGFGAIETGQHVFSHIEDRKLESATFKFMHIWQKKEGKWRITRLVTYGHPETWK